jgi:4-hydroxy-tetrahydrodipicolinate synthase
VTPYYNKPTQEGLYRHYKAIAEAVDIPGILYNVPGRTSVTLAAETVARLSKLENVVAIKESTGNMDLTSHILSLCDITVLSGDDSLTLPLMALGAKGVISVAANIIPGDIAEMVDAYLKGNHSKAAEIHYKIFGLCRSLFVETNPIPVKRAMKLLGFCSDEVRLPLCNLGEAAEKTLVKALKDYGLSLKG